MSPEPGDGDGGDGGGTGGTGGGTGGSGPPPWTLTVGAPVIWDSVLGDLQTFFDDMSSAVYDYHGGGADQNSYYDDGSDTAPMAGFFLEQFGQYLNPTQQNALGTHFYDYLTNGTDPEFMLASELNGNLGFNYSGGSVTVTPVNGSIANFNIRGFDLLGTFHVYGAGSTPPAGQPDDIVVNGSGGYWSFEYFGSPFSSDGGAPQSPGATVTPGTSGLTPAQAQADAEQHRLLLDARLHDFLNQHGGHYTVTFKGPGNSTASFDLADYVAILDRYNIQSTSGVDYHGISGGAGSVNRLPDGSYQTSIDGLQLVGYDRLVGGLDYLVLHEVAHELPIALSFTQSVHDAFMALNPGSPASAYLGTNGTNGSSALYMSESYANNIALAVENLIGVTPLANPGGGYDYLGVHH